MGRKSCKALIALCCLLVACQKDKPAAPATTVPVGGYNVYVVCEGNFGLGEASLYDYQPLKDSVYGDLYKSINNQPLGDVFQSMVRIGNRFFLCINNSDKIVVLNVPGLKLAGTIDIPKPRYILPVSATKAYVSSEYDKKVYIINPQTLQVTGTILLPHLNTEGMCLYYNDAFICTWDTASNQVYRVNTNTDQVTQSITVGGYAPQEVLLDKEQMLWVLSGDSYAGKSCVLTRLDPSTGETLAVYHFPAAANAVRPAFNVTKDTLYFIEANQDNGTANNGIYRMGIHDESLPAQAFVPAAQLQYFWALGIDPATGNIYVGDPKGFVQKGSIYIFRPDGTGVDTFSVGIGPGHFYFDE